LRAIELTERKVAVLHNQVIEAKNELHNAVLAREKHLPYQQELTQAFYASKDFDLQIDILKKNIDDLIGENVAEVTYVEIETQPREESPEIFEALPHGLSNRAKHYNLKSVYNNQQL
jgi:hypothetical protein